MQVKDNLKCYQEGYMSKSLMNQTQLLDVTLRDGGHTNNYNFSPEATMQIVSELDKSGIGHIEIGLRNGPKNLKPDLGPSALCSKDYLMLCRKLAHSSKITVMIHPENVKEIDFKEMQACGVDTLRICFSPQQELDIIARTVEMTKKYNFEVFINILSAARYSLTHLRQTASKLAKLNPNGIYIADSAGHLTPDKVSHLFSLLKQDSSIDFGYHGHDNLFLAQANALAAINAGVKYIDASASGLGRGVGNLRMEGIVSLLRSQGCMNFDIPRLLNLANYVHLNVRGANQPLPMKAIILGILNIPLQEATQQLDNTVDLEKYYLLAQEYAKKITESL